MTKLTVPVRFVAEDKPTLVMQETNHHSRMGNALHRWLNECVPGADASVLCYASELEYEITSGKRVMITQFDTALESASDTCELSLIGLDSSVGWKDIAGQVYVFSGTSMSGSSRRTIRYDPPIEVSYTDGYRNVGVRADANDGSAIVSFAWHGWVESEE